MLVRRLSLAFFALSVGVPVIAGAQAAKTSSPTAYEVKGVVTDLSHVPIPGVEVAAINGITLIRQTISADDGSFNLGSLPSGAISLNIRRLGYEPRKVDLTLGSENLASLDIVLKPKPSELEDVLISVNDRSRLREFYEHRGQRNSVAKFYDQDEIKKKGASLASDLFRSMPGITIKSANIGGNTIRIRGCQPMVWVDGQRVPDAELDEVIAPGDIAGIEFYTSMAGTPAQYMERTNRACGTVLVWTKNR